MSVTPPETDAGEQITEARVRAEGTETLVHLQDDDLGAALAVAVLEPGESFPVPAIKAQPLAMTLGDSPSMVAATSSQKRFAPS